MIIKQLQKPRNWVARSPVLGKGGVHQRTTRAVRRAAKVALVRQLRRDEQ